MPDTKNNLTRELHIRLKPADFNSIQKRFASSTCRKLSEFARDVLLNKPIVIKQRNQSLDDFMTEMIKLRNELNKIGNNFNQSVKKLYTLQQIGEFKTWLILNENDKKILMEKMNEIKLKINQFSDAWLQ
ncbi:MAG TPA: plasmid mobilization relaxosome protein MobC [Parafilimonas sp.]|nr:plasmid mobilization relaxosome protein MobC [Parafilimonas sp.]